MLSVNLKGQTSTSRPRAMLKTIFEPIFAIVEDILMQPPNALFRKGSHCYLNGLQLCLLSVIVLVLSQCMIMFMPRDNVM